MLCKILLEKTDEDHYMSLAEIMSALEMHDITAERKSLYDDFAVMRETLGVDVQKEQRGRETFYHVVNREFELAEVKILVDAIEASKFITRKKSQVLCDKLKGFVSEHQAKFLNRPVYVDDRIKNMNETIYYAVDDIHSAINANKQITFKYCYWTIDKELVPKKQGEKYKVSPYALTWANENYYMVAYDSEAGKIKHYRVDKMKETNITEEMRDGFKLFKQFDIAKYTLENFGMFAGEKRRVHIEFPNDKVGIFIDYFGKDIDLRNVSEDRSEAVVDVAVSQQFFGWIFSLGPDIAITKPEPVIKMMRDSIEKIKENY